MSNTTVVYPIVTALLQAEKVIGPQRDWQAANQVQKIFLQEFFESCRVESGSIAEIESIAAFTAEEINRFLRERGFKIELPPFQSNKRWQEFGIASVLDLLVSWFEPGAATTLKAQNTRSYPAVRQGTKVSSFYQSANHEYPIAHLKTTSSNEVYLTRLDKALVELDLLHYARQLASSLKPDADFGGVIFPMVELKQEVDVSWLIDLQTTNAEGRPVKITQALQETHLAMNEVGAHATSAFAGTVAVAAAHRRPRPDLLIDGPFLIWFQRPDLSEPLFVGHITEEDWKNPGVL